MLNEFMLHRAHVQLIVELLEDETQYLPSAKTEMIKTLKHTLENGNIPTRKISEYKQSVSLLMFLCARYESMLDKINVVPERTPEKPNSLEHTYWMCNQIRFGNMDNAKCQRWIGFVQSNLVRERLTTVDKERDITRAILKKL